MEQPARLLRWLLHSGCPLCTRAMPKMKHAQLNPRSRNPAVASECLLHNLQYFGISQTISLTTLPASGHRQSIPTGSLIDRSRRSELLICPSFRDDRSGKIWVRKSMRDWLSGTRKPGFRGCRQDRVRYSIRTATRWGSRSCGRRAEVLPMSKHFD